MTVAVPVTFGRLAATFGGFRMFSLRLLPYLSNALLRPRLITEQLYLIGTLSLVLTLFGGLFVGLFRATDQIAALDVMAIDPIQRIIVPRFLAGMISMPLLC